MQDISSFLEMGGYGAFVWPAYALSALVMVGFAVASWRELRARERVLRQLEATAPKRRRHRPAGERGETPA
jgi:heme exporter protein D